MRMGRQDAMADITGTAASYAAWFLVRYLVAVGALYAMSLVWSKAGFFARLLASWPALLFGALYGVVASIVLTLAGKQGISQWATGRAFQVAMRAATGVTFSVEDPAGVLAATRPAVFVGNHQTSLDVLMLACMFPRYCSVTAKTSLKYYPFLGWFMALSGTVFIDRANRQDARQAMSGAADAIRSRRQSVYIFPEGTRSNAQEALLLDFKKGAFHLAVQAGVPIVPVVVANYSHIYSTKKWVFRSGTIPIRGKPALPPRPTKPSAATNAGYSTGPDPDNRPDRRGRAGTRHHGARADAQGACEPHGKSTRAARGRPFEIGGQLCHGRRGGGQKNTAGIGPAANGCPRYHIYVSPSTQLCIPNKAQLVPRQPSLEFTSRRAYVV